MRTRRTPELMARARELREAGWSYNRIADEMEIDSETARCWLNPDADSTRRNRNKKFAGKRGHIVIRSPSRRVDCNYVSRSEADRDAERQLANIPPDDRTLTGRICGDPVFERSALAQRKDKSCPAVQS